MSFVATGELELHYLDCGRGDETIVFVHGNWCSARCWLPTLARLPQGYRALAYDQRGFGLSSKPPSGYSIAGRAQDLRGFADALGLTRFHLVGHSLGGAVAAQFAIEAPERVETLYLLDSAPPSGMPFAPEVRAYQERFAADRNVLAPALAAALCLPIDDLFFQALLDDAFGMARASVQQNLDALEGWQARDKLATLRVPTTVAWGAQDVVVTREMTDDMLAAIPNARREIFDDLGHSPNLADPDRFVTSLLASFARSNATPH